MLQRLAMTPLHDLGVEVLVSRLEEESEGRALTELAIHRKRAAVELRELECQRQADAHATLVPPLGALHLVKPFEDLRLLFVRDPRPRVGDLDGRSVWPVSHSHVDLPAGRGELHRVAKQIRENDFESVCIAERFDGLSMRSEGKLDVLGGRRRIGVSYDLLNEMSQIHPRDAKTQTTPLELGQVEQVVDHAQEPRGVSTDDLERITIRSWPKRI